MSVPSRRRGSTIPISVLTLLGVVEFMAAGLAVVFGFQTAEAPILFGLSVARLVLAVFAFAIAAAILGTGVFCIRGGLSLSGLARILPANLELWLPAAGIVGATLAWVCIFIPASTLGASAPSFSRLRPLLAAAGLLLTELSVASWLSLGPSVLRSLRRPRVADLRAFALTFVSLVALWLLMLATGFGVEKTSAFWNPPGVPLTGPQGIGLAALLFLGVLFQAHTGHESAFFRRRAWAWIIPAVICVCAAALWGLTPMQRHFFSLRPAAPSYEPFPFSDARLNDLGAISIINGEGIFFRGLTDKPLYMVFLAILHWLVGNNYVWLTRLQIVSLGSIPVMLFLLGKKFHSALVGAVVAVMTILQQWNSIRAALDIDSVNPKLLMTEMPALLGTVVIAYLAFRWFHTRQLRFALATGAAVGAASLIRSNPLFLFPVLGIVAAFLFRRRGMVVRQVLVFSVGFIVVFGPWMAVGTDPAGVPWAWVKFQQVIIRSQQTSAAPAGNGADAHPTVLPTPPTNMADTANGLASPTLNTGTDNTTGHGTPANAAQAMASGHDQEPPAPPLVERALSHTLHNMAAVLLSLPDVVTLDTLEALSQKPPWGKSTWTGALTPAQQAAALGNLLLLSIGLAWSWQHFRLAGLAPALVFAGYDLSLTVAMTSGGRYVVPINWVAHFYYALGLFAVADALLHAKRVPAAAGRPPVPANGSLHVRSFLPVGAAIAFVAILVPLANTLMPALITTNIEGRAKTALSADLPNLGPGEEWAYGEVLYPYYDPKTSSFSFGLLGDRGYAGDLTVARDDVHPPEQLQSASLAAVAASLEDGELQIKSVYAALAR